MSDAPTFLLDCRWLGPSGKGRATELLLRGLGELEPPGTWILWGPTEVASHLWRGARHELNDRDPMAMWGQGDARRIPPHDVALYPFQVRPLLRGPSVTLIHDTIQTRYDGNPVELQLKRVFLRQVAARSTRILTPSEFSRSMIERDLGAPASKIDVFRYPVDEDLVKRVHAAREELAPRDALLYVGQFAPYKNLDRLIRAFGESRFAADGGELLLVGENSQRAHRLEKLARTLQPPGVRVQGSVTQERLDELYATCRALVLPSLEEGFGLPAWEAMSVGLPLCVSDRGALPEIVLDADARFDPTSIPEIARHIDRVTASAAEIAGPALPPNAGSFRAFAADVLSSLGLVVDPR
ncbi:MAG: glycosyltransferase family 4 protein [Actinomycetota bacterium]